MLHEGLLVILLLLVEHDFDKTQVRCLLRFSVCRNLNQLVNILITERNHLECPRDEVLIDGIFIIVFVSYDALLPVALRLEEGFEGEQSNVIVYLDALECAYLYGLLIFIAFDREVLQNKNSEQKFLK